MRQKFHSVNTRQPLLWAALAYAAGILLNTRVWRPPHLWFVAALVMLAAAAYFLRQRARWASLAGLAPLVALGALAGQLRLPPGSGAGRFAPFLDESEATITAHVTHAKPIQPTLTESARQVLELETEQLAVGGEQAEAAVGLRLNVYTQRGEAQMEPFAYGQRLRFTGQLRQPRNYRNPGAFDYEAYMASRGMIATTSARVDKIERLPGFAGNRWELWRSRIHGSIVAKIHELWSPAKAALVDAMVIGEDAFLEPDVRADFQRSGTYHILVVSGINVGILAASVFWLLRKLRTSATTASAVTVLLAIAYAYVTDVGAPIWRATLMMAIYLGARLLYREQAMLNAIGAAALALLLLDPQALLGVSFQLTFLCVLVIGAIAMPILERTSAPFRAGLSHLESVDYDFALLPRVIQFRLNLRLILGRLQKLVGMCLSRWLLIGTCRSALAAYELLLVSALMQVSLALPMAFYYHRAPNLSLPANLAVVPLTGVLMPAAVAAVALGFVWNPLARVPALLAGFALSGITGSVRWIGGLRAADLRVPTPDAFTALVAVASLSLAMLLVRRRMRLALASLVVLTGAAVWIAAGPERPVLRRGVLEVTCIDVGEGDSCLTVTPEGKRILVDAGGPTGGPHISQYDIGENVVAPYLWSRGFRRIDVAVITHAHSDHIGGMKTILDNFQPQELWLSVIPPSEDLRQLLELARVRGIRVLQFAEGDSFDFGGARVRVLAPARDWHSFRVSNNDSLALHLQYGATAALLEGDAEASSEMRIAREHPSAMLLKVAHHGSKTSAIPDLLQAVRPTYALVSVGMHNPFHFPRPDVLERLEKAAIVTYRTDLDGGVTFFLDGRTVTPRLTVLP